MTEQIIHSFESGRRGKPDELDSNIAHLIGSHLLGMNPKARFDIRIEGGYSRKRERLQVNVSGEVSGSLLTPKLPEELTDLTLVHYNRLHGTVLNVDDIHFNYEELNAQESDLALNGNIGDDGRPIAVAFRDAPYFLPHDRFIAVAVRDLFDTIFNSDGYVPREVAERTGIRELPDLRQDGKITVDGIYEGAKWIGIHNLTASLNHDPDTSFEMFRSNVDKIVRGYVAMLAEQYSFAFGTPVVRVNPKGPWGNEGGWKVDRGSREAKPQRHFFGTHGVAEDSPYGEDASKPSGTGTYLARYIAVQIVGNGLAEYARVALDCTMGQKEVRLLNISTLGTATLPQQELERWVQDHIPLGFEETIERFHLRSPEIYHKLVQDSDLFHNSNLPWNKFEVKYKK
ncbi:MAG: methionine adenosyltransferase domain-containing protein [Nanoarchaeota archaeon]|nr:methionine adenosyltransferase domain-containing protein [Nanoarchaeota archaeon]